jgi:hypothetical protein
MRKMPCIPLIAALSLALAAPVAAQQRDRNWDEGPRETERVEKTAQIRAGGTLKLKNFSGEVTITGSNRGDLQVRAVRRATRERLDHIKLEVTETASGVTIEANKKDPNWKEDNNNVVETDMEIQLPADVNLDVDVFSSDVTIKDVRGKQRVKTFSGQIEVAGAESSINAETFSGDIEMTLAQGAGGRVDFDTFSGALKTDLPMTTNSAGRKNITGTIGGGTGADYRFKTFSGDVRIR